MYYTVEKEIRRVQQDVRVQKKLCVLEQQEETNDFMKNNFENVKALEENKDLDMKAVEVRAELDEASGTEVCNICDLKFLRATSLNRHMRVHLTKTDEIVTDEFFESATMENALTTGYPMFFNDQKKKGEVESALTKLVKTVPFQSIHIKPITYQLNPVMKGYDMRRFQCEVCPCSFEEALVLKRHLNIHYLIEAREAPSNCQYCKKHFRKEKNLKTHIKEIHEGKRRKFPCDVCTKVFPRKKSMKRHRYSVHKNYSPDLDLDLNRTDDCTYCKKHFRNQKNLKAHIKEIHEGKRRKLPCGVCTKVFPRKSSMERHMNSVHQNYSPDLDLDLNRTNDDDNKVKENYDSEDLDLKQTTDKINKENEIHSMVATEDDIINKLIEEVDDRKQGNKPKLRHILPKIRMDQYIQCSQCQRWFPSKEDLSNHIEENHMTSTPIEEIYQYKCSDENCLNIKFQNKDSLLLHIQQKHVQLYETYKALLFLKHEYQDTPTKELAKENVNEAKVGSDNLDCAHCHKKFDTWESLSQHITGGTLPSLLLCDASNCESSFMMKCELERHQLEECGLIEREMEGLDTEISQKLWETFGDIASAEIKEVKVENQALDRIGQYMSGYDRIFPSIVSEDMFNEIVPKLFGIPKPYVKSAKMHFACENCPKTFTGKFHLARHNLSRHSGIRISCDDCGKTFTRKDKLNEHKRVVHLTL